MPDEDPLARIRAALHACAGALNEFGAPYTLIGAVAVGLVAQPRATRDVDASLWLEDDKRLGEFLAVCARHGLCPRPGVTAAIACRIRLVPLLHGPSQVGVDIALAVMPFEQQMIRNAQPVLVDGVQMVVPRPDDLLVTKAVAQRDRDLIDIGTILRLRRDVDLAHVRLWVRRIAKILDSPDIVANLERRIEAADREYARLTGPKPKFGPPKRRKR